MRAGGGPQPLGIPLINLYHAIVVTKTWNQPKPPKLKSAKTTQNHLQPSTKPAKRTQNHLQYTLYDRFVCRWPSVMWRDYHVDNRPQCLDMRCVKKRTRQKHIECIVCLFHKNEGLRYSSVFAFATLQQSISCYEVKSIGSDMKILCQNCHEENYSWY